MQREMEGGRGRGGKGKESGDAEGEGRKAGTWRERRMTKGSIQTSKLNLKQTLEQ